MIARARAWFGARRVVVLLVVIAVASAALLQGDRMAGWLGGEDGRMVVTADFGDTTGLYVGNQVTYLGVPVGEVVAVEPQGTTMRVEMRLEPDTRVPREAGAEILQGSLVTDRYVELGPAYRGGPALTSGAHIDAEHTRSPATVDEIATAVDDLVLALDGGRQGDGNGLGELLATSADALDGNGEALATALSRGQRALEILNTKGDDLESVTVALGDVVDMLAARDRLLRRFTRHSVSAAEVLADQRHEVEATLDSLDDLVGVAEELLRENGDLLAEDLASISSLVSLVREHQDSLAEAFDVMPTMAENFARAYDWDLGRLRVQFSFAVGPFSAVFRERFCRVLAGTAGLDGLCRVLFQPDGTGLLDPLLDGVYDALPGEIP